MADWTALVTEPAKEYVAQVELQRFGLSPYLPQAKRQWSAPRTTRFVLRSYPLFAGYILILLDDAGHPAIHEARGVRKFRTVLCHDDGAPWRCPGTVIDAIRIAEARGDFDEQSLHRGDKVTMRAGILHGVEAVVGRAQAAKTIQLLLPLMGGVRAMASQSKVMRVAPDHR